jgi:hypothetical protein
VSPRPGQQHSPAHPQADPHLAPTPNLAPLDSAQRATTVRDRLPPGGLFAHQDWRVAPIPFPLEPAVLRELESLGRVLLQFNRAVNLLYRQSVAGKQPAWIAQWLDLGKPRSLIELQRHPALKNEWPRVIRPDLLLTEDGLAITELDAVPGGIGLTAWLNQTYSNLGDSVLGGADNMLRGFEGIFDKSNTVHIVVSNEAATYRPEMEWIISQLNQSTKRFVLHDSTPFDFAPNDAVYRFFELFDLQNIQAADSLLAAACANQINLTPPPRAFFEEKLLFALLWNGHLTDFWRHELGERFFHHLLSLVPYTWILDPSPMPPHAAIPELNLTDWRQLKLLSQRQRDLILKISGFSPDAWGSRGVRLGSDLSSADWSAAVDHALESFLQSPHILQRYAKPRTVNFDWFNFDQQHPVSMKGRVRLCPYYFVHGNGDAARAHLGGALATICPADKKIIHGMSEAILAPCSL